MKLQHGSVWLLLLVLTQGCATLMQGSTQQVVVTSTPSGATVVVDRSMRFTTPAALELARRESHTLELSLEGYHPETVNVRSVASGMVAGNILAGGLIGFAVDHSSGAAFRLVPEVVQVSLRPIAPEPQNTPLAAPADASDAEKKDSN